MNIKDVKLTEEMMKKLDEVESLEELKALAKEIGIEITDEELAEYFDEELKAFKLPEESLEQVAGGKCFRDSCKKLDDLMRPRECDRDLLPR